MIIRVTMEHQIEGFCWRKFMTVRVWEGTWQFYTVEARANSEAAISVMWKQSGVKQDTGRGLELV